MKKLTSILSLLLLFTLLSLSFHLNANPARHNKKVALVIGNTSYENAPLRNPHLDALGISDALDELGMTVILAEDVGLSEFNAEIENFKNLMKDADVALFYYAGHGVEENGQNYLIPIGGDMNIEDESELPLKAFSLNSLLQIMDESGPKTKIVILDACRNNPLKRNNGTTIGSKAGLVPVQSPSMGTLISFSTAPKSAAKDGIKGQNSPFARHLIANLKKRDHSILEILTEVRKGVWNDAKQMTCDTNSLPEPIYLANNAKHESNFPHSTPVVGPVIPKLTPTFVEKKYFILEGRKGFYTGELLNNQFHGMGEFVWVDSTGRKIYQGEWREGKENGHGTLISSTGIGLVLKGDWKEGKKEGAFSMTTLKDKGRTEIGGLYYLHDKRVDKAEYEDYLDSLATEGNPTSPVTVVNKSGPNTTAQTKTQTKIKHKVTFEEIKNLLLNEDFSKEEVSQILIKEKNFIKAWIADGNTAEEIAEGLANEHGK